MPASPLTRERSLPTVRNGLFFTLPEALPRGRHKLSSEEVRGGQRERILAATTELLAAEGYRGFNVNDIARRASLSLQVLYGTFENKEQCIFEGYDRFIQVLLKQMTAVPIVDVERIPLVTSIVGKYLDTMQSDLVVARAYQVEVDALGGAARQRRRKSLTLFAAFLREAVIQSSPDRIAPAELTPESYLAVVYGVRQLASDALDARAEPNLSALRTRLEPWLHDVFRAR